MATKRVSHLTEPDRDLREIVAMNICRAAFGSCACADRAGSVCDELLKRATIIEGEFLAKGWKAPRNQGLRGENRE